MVDQNTRQQFDRHLQPVLEMAYRYALRLSGQPDDAKDLVQDAVLRAYKSYHTFQVGSNFKAWLFTILTHRFYAIQARDAKKATVALDDAPDVFLYDQALRLGTPMDGDPAAHLMQKLDGEAAQDAMLKLPEEYRVVCALHFLSDMRYDEIAETLGIPVGTVRSRLHRGRNLLQVALWHIAEERGYVTI